MNAPDQVIPVGTRVRVLVGKHKGRVGIVDDVAPAGSLWLVVRFEGDGLLGLLMPDHALWVKYVSRELEIVDAADVTGGAS